jgi:hypothetical protein
VLVVGAKLALAACLVVLPLAACGTASREHDAAAVAERFQAALRSSDGKAACAELSAETVSKLEQQERKPCERAILGLELPKGGSVAFTEIEVTSAYVRLAGGGADFLDEGPEGWSISAAGCRPTRPELPYECELEG